MKHPIHKRLRQFPAAQEGNVLLMTVLFFFVLLGLVGMGIDLGRQQLVRIKLQQASDAGALAGALAPNVADQSSTALRYFNLNFPDTYMDVPRPTPSISTSGGVSVSARASVNTYFMQYLGDSTVAAAGSSKVDTAATASSDYDVVMVVDESGSESAALPPYATREQAQQAALTAMANTILPTTGTPNPNVRMGFIGFTGYISNKWGLSSNNADAMTAISKLRPISQNFDHLGMLGAVKMLKGGTASVANAQITIPGYSTQNNTDMPVARTARTNASDANGISPAKFVVFISDGGIMLEPTDTPYIISSGGSGGSGGPYGPYGPPGPHGGGGGPSSTPDPNYDVTGLIHTHCPGRSASDPECFAAFVDACGQVKNMVGTDSVHMFVINLNNPVTSTEQNTLVSCASSTIPGGPTYSTSVKPDASKDFYFAQDAAALQSLLSNITTTIKKVRITQ